MSEILNTLTVLYVEDDVLLQSVVSRLLKRRVKTLYQAGDGREGLEIVKQHQPQMVITDLEMPVMDGFTMIQEIRKINRFIRPIIVLTAHNDQEHHTDLANGYVYKPVTMTHLFEMMEHLANKYLPHIAACASGDKQEGKEAS